MFGILPIGFLKVFFRIPWVNITLMVICVAVYALEVVAPGPWKNHLMAWPIHVNEGAYDPAEVSSYAWIYQPWTLITCGFMHGDISHLLGNMLFLFIFGCGLNADLGHWRYIAVVAFFATISSLVQVVFSDLPLIGASGFMAGVTGMVVALYPLCEVRLLVFVWVIVPFYRVLEVSALWVIGMSFLWDAISLSALGDSSNIAYLAHLTGYVAGFLLGVVAIQKDWYETDGFDFLTWYFGHPSEKGKKRRRNKKGVRLKPGTIVVASKEPLNWDPIPLCPDSIPLSMEGPAIPTPARATSVKERDRADAEPRSHSKSRASRSIHDAGADADAGNQEDLDRLLRFVESRQQQWEGDDWEETWSAYSRCRSRGRGLIPAKVELSIARSLADRGEKGFALAVYQHLLDENQEPRFAPVALEAAQRAYKWNEPTRAGQFLVRALKGPLKPEHAQLANVLQSRLQTMR